MRQLVDKTPVSDLSDELEQYATQIYTCIKQLSENAALAIQTPRRLNKRDDAKDGKIVDYVNHWNQQGEVLAKQIVTWLDVGGSKYFD